jgi:hypothetical protein
MRRSNITYSAVIRALVVLLCLSGFSSLAFGESSNPASAKHEVLFAVDISEGGDDLRTTEVRKYFENLDRKFEVYRVRPTKPTAAGKHYKLERERAGNFRYNSLKVVKKTFFGKVAKSVSENFVALEDTVHNDDSEVTGVELLQIIYRNAKALKAEKTDLDSVTNGVTLTYVYDDFETILVPTTYNFKDNAVNTEGTPLKSKYGVNAFSKHYLLALILNQEAEVTMAGKMYIAVQPLDDTSPIKLDSVFNADGDVDLDHYEFKVTMTNDSGTFKPDANEVPLFAQALVDTLNISEVHYSAWTPEGEPRVEGTVSPSR